MWGNFNGPDDDDDDSTGNDDRCPEFSFPLPPDAIGLFPLLPPPTPPLPFALPPMLPFPIKINPLLFHNGLFCANFPVTEEEDGEPNDPVGDELKCD